MEKLLPGFAFAENLHPMVVHFPIAFWVAATAAWFLALARTNDTAWRFGLWLHALALGSAAVAVAFGYWATEKMGHDSPGHDLVHVHRDFMLVATGLALLLTVAAWLKRQGGGGWRLGFSFSSAVLLGVMTLGADRGAELVYRYGVGVSRETPAQSGHHHGDGAPHADMTQAMRHAATQLPRAPAGSPAPSSSTLSIASGAGPEPPMEKSPPSPAKPKPKGHENHTH